MKSLLLLMLVGALVAFASGAARPVLAATLVVNSLGDEPDASINGNCLTALNTCTLRAAIQEANAIGGVDEIVFSVTGTIELASGLPPITEGLTINGPGQALLTVDSNSTGTIFTNNANTGITDLTLTGASTSAVVANSAWTSLVNAVVTNNAGTGGAGLQINAAARLTLINSLVSNNQGDGVGIGINGSTPGGSLVQGTIVEGNTGAGVHHGGFVPDRPLQIVSSTIRNNGGDGVRAGTDQLGDFAGSHFEMSSSTVNNNGGRGLVTLGQAQVTGSTISGNSGGGVFNRGANLTVTNSTISGNSADSGAGVIVGALHMLRSTTRINNSTVSGNVATTRGGGIFNPGGLNSSFPAVVEVTNSTISGNQAPSGAGISFVGPNGSTSVTHATIANNTGATGAGVHSTGTPPIFGSGFHSISSLYANNGPNCSLIAAPSGGANLTTDNTCGFTGPVNIVNTPAGIGPLANNGGPTQTHALLPGSAALETGAQPCQAATDQRGTVRPQGALCDIGAFEAAVAPLLAPSNVNAQLASPTSINVTFTDNATDETGLEIQRSINGAAFNIILSTNAPLSGAQSGWYYPDTGLGAGINYCYKLRVKRGAEFSPFSNTSCAMTPASSGVAAPSNVNALPDGPSTINVTFADNANDETGIEIERKTGMGGTYGIILSTNSALPGAQAGWYYPDTTGLSAGTMYCYRMRAKQGVDFSAYSNESCATTAAGGPPAPSNVAITGATGSKLDVSFTDNATGEDGIEIERKTGVGGTYAFVFLTGTLPGTQGGWYWPNTGLDPSTTYCYRLRTKQGATYSAYTPDACGTTTSGAPASSAATVAPPPGAKPVPATAGGIAPKAPSSLPPGSKPMPLMDRGAPAPAITPPPFATPPPGARPVPGAGGIAG